MKSINVYQADPNGFFLYESKAHELALDPGNFNVPFGAVSIAPPEAIAGQVAQLVGGEWTLVEDHRADTLYVIANGTRYTLGEAVDGQCYDGGGPLPEWLTDIQPQPAEPVEPSDPAEPAEVA